MSQYTMAKAVLTVYLGTPERWEHTGNKTSLAARLYVQPNAQKHDPTQQVVAKRNLEWRKS